MIHQTSCNSHSTIKLCGVSVAIMLLFGTLYASGQISAFADHTSQNKKLMKDVKNDEKKIKSKIKETKPQKPISIPSTSMAQKPKQATDSLETKLKACKDKSTEREQYECEKAIKTNQALDEFKSKSTKQQIGPILFYYAGAKVEQSGGKDIVNLKFLVENTSTKDNITLYCTGPAICNYDVSDGKITYKYSAQDFTNGQIVLKPGSSRIFNMLFGPAIGYGSYEDFKFDPSKQYTFNVKEPWGSGSIPLNLK